MTTNEQSAADKLLQTNKHGHKEGKNPLSLDINLIEAAGHEDLPLAKVIRQKCLECCNFQVGEIRKCICTECPLYPHRMGKNPFTSAKRKKNKENTETD